MNGTSRSGLRSRLLGGGAFSRTAVAALAVGLSLSLAACGSSDSGGSSSAEVDDAGLTEAKANLDAYREPPKWQGPDAPVDLSGLAGKKVTYISVSNGIPVLKYWSDAIKALVKSEAGVELSVVDAKGSVDEANKGFQQAIASQADAVVIVAFSTDLFAKQIADAKDAGLKVITAQSGIPGKVDGGQDAEVTFYYEKVGELIGDWFIVDSKGKGKGLVITSDDVPASQPQAQATLAEVKDKCPACDLKVEDVQIPQWEASIPTLFQSTVNSDPERTYYLPLYDGQGLSGLGALRTAGADKVKVGAFNATPGIVEQLKDDKSNLKLDIGGHNEWWVYAAADTIFRVLSDTEPVENYNVGLRIFDTSNADLIEGDNELEWYEFDGYKTEFGKLWKK